MSRLIVREDYKHRLGYAQCAGILRLVARFNTSCAVHTITPPVIWVEEHQQSVLTSTHERPAPTPQHAFRTSADH
jgi:hypothetical protein